MTREETKKILFLIKRSFPQWTGMNGSDQEAAQTIDVWHAILRDDDYHAIEAGLMNYIRNDRSGFAPAPGQIRTNIMDLAEEFDDTEDAIAELRKALSNSSYGYKEEFEWLSPALKKAVGNAENLRAWAQLDQNELESVAFSHVRRAYRNIKTQEKKIRQMDPVKDELLEDAERRARWLKMRAAAGPALEQKPITNQIEQKPVHQERKSYEPQLLPEERDAIIRVWNDRDSGAMPMSELFFSPARDAKLREIIDKIGLREILIRIQSTETKTFGGFIEEVES